jgi:hypothetical protein
MKGGRWMKSPKWGGAVHFVCLAGLLLVVISSPTASAWSFPFSIPFLSGSDEGCELSLDLDSLLVEPGSIVTYTIHLKNSGQKALIDVSVTDNFGQAGFIASLQGGESFDVTRTTPPLESSTQLKVFAFSDREEISRAEAIVQVGPSEEGFSAGAEPERRAELDQTLTIMSSTPEIGLVVGADPKSVLPGEETTARMTVTNRGSVPLRDLVISGPSWTIEGGELEPGESKTFSRAMTITEDLSAEVTVAGTTDGGETAVARGLLKVATVRKDLTVTVVSTPASSGQPATTEYRLVNEGEVVFSRVTLKNDVGAILGILPRLGPGESESLIRTSDDGAGGLTEVTAVSPEGETVIGKVVVQPVSSRPGDSVAEKPASRSGSARNAEPAGFGAVPEFEAMEMDSTFRDLGSGFDAFETATETRRGRSAEVSQPEVSQPQGSTTQAGFGGFDLDFDFGDFGFGEIFGGGGNAPKAPAAVSETVPEETETGSPELVVTLQANRTLVHKGDLVGYRCSAVNRGTAALADVTLRCGEGTATAPRLAPGDGLPLEGAMRVEGPLNLTAAATASGPEGTPLADEATLDIGVVSPDLSVHVEGNPERICRGQRVSISVRLENTGDDPLSDVRVTDSLGEIGKIPLLKPGEARTLMRNSALGESFDDQIAVVAVDSTGRRLERSASLTFQLLEPSLNLTVDPANVVAYSGETVEAVWTIRNTGEVDLVDVTFEGGSSRFRLPAVAAGGSTPVSSTYFAEEKRAVSGRAEGKTLGGETVSSDATFEIRVISPGISLNVKPLEVEATPGQIFNLTCLVTNSGDDPLKDVVLSERSLGTVEKIVRLEPGDFRVADLGFFADSNTTLRLEAEGIDSRGKAWTDSRDVAVSLVSAKVELSVRADPAETTSGGSVNVISTVENRGDVPIFSTFIMGSSLGTLGTIDYVSPGSIRTLEREIAVSGEIEEEITAEGFTKDGASVRDEAILAVGLIEVPPPVEDEAKKVAYIPSTSGTSAAEEGAEVEDHGEIGPDEMVNASEVVPSEVQEGASPEITGLMDRLRDILEGIRLKKDSSKETMDAASSEMTMPTGSEAAFSSSATPTASPPSSSAEWSGYGVYEASPASLEDAVSEGAGYDYSAAGPASEDLSPLKPTPEMVAYSYSAEGIASSYMSSPWGRGLSASDPVSAYLSSPSASPGTWAYASAGGGPSFSPASPAGISADLAGSATTARYQASDPRSASETSPKVAESGASVEGSSHGELLAISPEYAKAAASAGSPSTDRPLASTSPAENFRLVIGDLGEIEVDRPPRIIDVGAFPPEPTAWTPVVVAVHASDDMGIRSVEMLWDSPTTSVSRLDLADVTKINSQRMELEEGDVKDGYWSYEIPGQAPGTYMAVFVKVSDGERWAEDGPYILFWSTAAPEIEAVPPAPEEPPAEEDGGRKAIETKKVDGMLFVESTTVIGRGDVSIKNEVREESARYKEELDGYGSIEMQSEKVINKGNPVVNISDSRLLVFDQGYLKGFKVMQSPAFHGGMGASVTEQFSATTLEKSETGTLSSANWTEHTLLFNTQQAFEGLYGTKTEYSNFNKKIKANQQLNGTFETQKRISFED